MRDLELWLYLLFLSREYGNIIFYIGVIKSFCSYIPVTTSKFRAWDVDVGFRALGLVYY